MDPDHLSVFQIDSLYFHWLGRQNEGLPPFIVLNAPPLHITLKKSVKDKKGKGKMEYDDVSSEKDSDKEEPPVLKFGPPIGKWKTQICERPNQEAGPSMTPKGPETRPAAGEVRWNSERHHRKLTSEIFNFQQNDGKSSRSKSKKRKSEDDHDAGRAPKLRKTRQAGKSRRKDDDQPAEVRIPISYQPSLSPVKD